VGGGAWNSRRDTRKSTRGNRKYPEISREKQIERKKEREYVAQTKTRPKIHQSNPPPKKKQNNHLSEMLLVSKEMSSATTLSSLDGRTRLSSRAADTSEACQQQSLWNRSGETQPPSVVASLIANPSLRLKPGPAHLSVRSSVLPSIQQRRRDPPVAFALSILPRFPRPYFNFFFF
jgi:hypothetical protein